MKASVDQQLLVLQLADLARENKATLAGRENFPNREEYLRLFARYEREAKEPLERAREVHSQSSRDTKEIWEQIKDLLREDRRLSKQIVERLRRHEYNDLLRREVASCWQQIAELKQEYDELNAVVKLDHDEVIRLLALSAEMWEPLGPLHKEKEAHEKKCDAKIGHNSVRMGNIRDQLLTSLEQEYDRLCHRNRSTIGPSLASTDTEAVGRLSDGMCGLCGAAMSREALAAFAAAPNETITYCPECEGMLVRPSQTAASTPPSLGKVWLAVGRNLGFTFTSDGASAEIMPGGRVYRITSEQHLAWSTLHAVETSSPYGALIEELAASDAGDDPEFAPFLKSLAELIDLGLIVPYHPRDPASREEFTNTYKLVPLQTVYGDAEDRESFVLTVAGQSTLIVSAYTRVLLTCSQAASIIADSFSGVKEITGNKYLTPSRFTFEMAPELPKLLRNRAAALDLAAPVDPPPQRIDPQGVSHGASLSDLRRLIGFRARIPRTVYAVGYHLGFHYSEGWTQDYVSVGGHEIRVPGGAPQRYCWDAAQAGIRTESDLSFDYFDILDDAQHAGAEDPRAALDGLLEEQLVVAPKNDRELIEFAATHQLVPLLDGLSVRDADGNATLGLSVQDKKTMVTVTADEYDAWRASLTAPTLLDLAAAFGRADSGQNLDYFLKTVVHGLQSRGAAYIDMAATE